MIPTRNLIDVWRAQGIDLWDDDGRLRYRAPRGVVTAETLQELKARKDEILTVLRADRGPSVDSEHRYDPFPLTDVQSAYLMGRSGAFDHSGVACHLYCEVEYPRLQMERACTAWQELVRRHDMLRVRIDPAGYQQVLADVPPLPITVTELSDAQESTRAEHVQQVRAAMSHAVHPVGQWPMFAVAFTQPHEEDPDGATLMHVSYDFLMGDWASLLSLLRQWEELYNGAEGAQCSPVLFRDFVVWERGQREKAPYRQARDYWLQRIDELPAAPQISLSETESESACWSGIEALIAPEAWNTIRSRAQAVGLTPTAVVLTCYADVLAQWAQDRHFCLNLTVLDRPAEVPGVDEIIGDFTTVTLLEVGAKAGSFTERATQVMHQLLEDLDHRAFSGVEVMREIARRRGRHTAAMPYVFTSAIGVGSQDSAEAQQGKIVHSISQTPQAVLDCQVMDDADGLHIHLDGRVGALQEAVRKDMAEVLVAALEKLASDEDAWDAFSPVRLPQWQQVERNHANNTAGQQVEGTLHGALARAAAAAPNAPAVISDQVCWSHAQLQQHALTVSAALRQRGVQPGDRVAVCVPRSPEQIAAVLGVLALGAAYVPIDVRHPSGRRSMIARSAEVRVFIHDASTAPETLDGVTAVELASLLTGEAGDAATLAADVGHPDDLAYVIFTSGSTGTPKGVRMSHRAALNTIEDVNRRCGVDAASRSIAIADLSFDLSVYDIFGPLSQGGAVVLPPAEAVPNPAAWLSAAADNGVTIFNTVPAVAQMMLSAVEGGALPPSGVRTWILSGDRIPRDLVRRLHEVFPGTIFEAMGGATEAAIWSIAHRIDLECVSGEIPYGTPLANQRFAVIDQAGQDRPVGVSGEIVILGAGLAQGYEDCAQTERAFIDDPVRGRFYRTGDAGRYLPGGDIEIEGRLDDQVKIRGHRIELGEVESVLVADPSVRQAAVVVAGEGAQRALHGFIVAEQGSSDAAGEPVAQAMEEAAGLAADVVDCTDAEGIAAYATAMEKACVASIVEVLGRVDAGLPVAAAHQWIVDLWRQTLAAWHPHLLSGGNQGVVNPGLAVGAAEVQRLWEEVGQLSPRGADYRGVTAYVRRCADVLPQLLSGEQRPSDLLFTDGVDDSSAQVYRKRLSMRWGTETVAHLVERLVEGDPQRPLRVLEIGAGTGSTTDAVLRGLGDRPYEYVFSDRASFFLDAAQQRWSGDPRMTFTVFDLDKDPVEQGIELGSFDLVCAFGVLENARHIPRALDRVAALACPGGVVVISEPVGVQWWIMVSQIFMMTRPEPSSRPEGVLFPDGAWWAAHIGASTGSDVALTPAADSVLAPEGFGLFASRVGCSAVDCQAQDQSILATARQQLPEVMVPVSLRRLPQLPLTPNGKVDRRALVNLTRAQEAGQPVQPKPQESFTCDLTETAATWAQLLTQLWKEHLGSDSELSWAVNPYDLGANSVSAAAVSTQVRDRLGDGVSFEAMLRILLTAPDIAATAIALERLEANSDPTSESASADAGQTQEPVRVISLGEPTAAPAVTTVVFSDSLASADSMRPLLRRLWQHPDAQELFGADSDVRLVEVPDDEWFCSLPAASAIQQIAANVAACLEQTGAQEYCLIGYSFGSLVAIEVARHLIENGHTVRPLGLIDPHVVPAGIHDRLAEVMFITSLGAQTQMLFPDAPPLVALLDSVVSAPAAHPDAAAFFASLDALSEQDRWELYATAVSTSHRRAVCDLQRMWRRYRHTMNSAMEEPADLVVDAVIIQPCDHLGFRPGAHDEFFAVWQERFIGDIHREHVPGNHFTLVTGEFASTTAQALIAGYRALV
ncbi:amino acid adenylation domain-containing protein [Dermatophilus congolensis]|uniref:amino acid adenylation domain-containing protein n=1 Tax=Dermatophilus congolensis TaxID=1863 RepID=UPI001AAE3DE1|nr:amino acid adenylation domain-containing protein [Dermatophilus congolensis]MBO3132047.1 amino acid adenylation domain-containing protein [Dermatophilus congolensis]MBO3133797.1 amino acid adenylation domain-containing protein [Dermatophilus congolensis]MBO3136028.1 amino acid adenylation domain-containing protein [Dermatophilus congolensis]MBO3138270.1 amino acid adenylation domain-containing protein [Dermatophilus congolensis]